MSELGISFNESKIDEGNGLVGNMSGGSCTAMALGFIDKYIEIEKKTHMLGLDRSERPPAAVDLFILMRIRCSAKHFLHSSEIMRSRQAAYNTIEVTDPSSDIDHTKNKIQSIVNFYKFKIDFSSQEIDLTEVSNPDQLSPHIEALPNGIFIIRSFKPADNEKLEEYGHTTVYINEPSYKVFYDPGRGAWSIDGVSEYLFNVFASRLQLDDISKVRFFHIQAIQA